MAPEEAPEEVTDSPTVMTPEEAPEEVTGAPSASPTAAPTKMPTESPTASPTDKPSAYPTSPPSAYPTEAPTKWPSAQPSANPSATPSAAPSASPSAGPSASPSAPPSSAPSSMPQCDGNPWPQTNGTHCPMNPCRVTLPEEEPRSCHMVCSAMGMRCGGASVHYQPATPCQSVCMMPACHHGAGFERSCICAPHHMVSVDVMVAVGGVGVHTHVGTPMQTSVTTSVVVNMPTYGYSTTVSVQVSVGGGYGGYQPHPCMPYGPPQQCPSSGSSPARHAAAAGEEDEYGDMMVELRVDTTSDAAAGVRRDILNHLRGAQDSGELLKSIAAALKDADVPTRDLHVIEVKAVIVEEDGSVREEAEEEVYRTALAAAGVAVIVLAVLAAVRMLKGGAGRGGDVGRTEPAKEPQFPPPLQKVIGLAALPMPEPSEPTISTTPVFAPARHPASASTRSPCSEATLPPPDALSWSLSASGSSVTEAAAAAAVVARNQSVYKAVQGRQLTEAEMAEKDPAVAALGAQPSAQGVEVADAVVALARKDSAGAVTAEDLTPFMVTAIVDDVYSARSAFKRKTGRSMTTRDLKDSNPALSHLYVVAHKAGSFDSAVAVARQARLGREVPV
eukprot:TRINITY_DN1450_c0_g1_i10.p1 TRINITY_DN1450_c0_g1~~TRINITY_DN1450_c0_g1_i10.p1  ORF type:complete len:618 (+),score=214.88 TRINITY_DN1450_c0_g1_i10:297-2150(+)